MNRAQLETARYAKKRYGYTAEETPLGDVNLGGDQTLAILRENGSFAFRNGSDVTEDEEKVTEDLYKAFQQNRELCDLLEQAPPLKPDVFRRGDGYSKLAEFDLAVLGVKDLGGDQGFAFATWHRQTKETLDEEERFSDYAAAKRSFAIRANLIGEDQLAEPELEDTQDLGNSL